MPSPQKMLSIARLNFVSRSWIKEARPLAAVVEIHQQVACLLRHPGRVGLARAGDVFDAARSDRDEQQHIQPAEPDGVDDQPLSFSALFIRCTDLWWIDQPMLLTDHHHEPLLGGLIHEFEAAPA
jgi:hypothetical protein